MACKGATFKMFVCLLFVSTLFFQVVSATDGKKFLLKLFRMGFYRSLTFQRPAALQGSVLMSVFKFDRVHGLIYAPTCKLHVLDKFPNGNFTA